MPHDRDALLQDVTCPYPGCGWKANVSALVAVPRYWAVRHTCTKKVCGRPFYVVYYTEPPKPGRPRHTEVHAVLANARAQGRELSARQLAREANCGLGTAHRALFQNPTLFWNTPTGPSVRVVTVERGSGRTAPELLTFLQRAIAITATWPDPMTDDDVAALMAHAHALTRARADRQEHRRMAA